MKPENENFFERVYQVARLIPEGRVTSYGAIAKYLGAARSARMVGWAMNASHNMDDIPAHRVVNKAGLLTGKHHWCIRNPTKGRNNRETQYLDPVKQAEAESVPSKILYMYITRGCLSFLLGYCATRPYGATTWGF